jgi:hypothetical protein
MVSFFLQCLWNIKIVRVQGSEKENDDIQDRRCFYIYCRCLVPSLEMDHPGACNEDLCSSDSLCSGALLPVCGKQCV